MSAVSDHAGHDASPRAHYTLSIGKLQRCVLWFFAFCGCFALIEPSPYEVMFLVTVFVFMVTGLRVNAKIIPMMALLLLFNVGGVFSLIPFMDEPASVRFIAVSVYLMFTALLFAALMSEDAESRLQTIGSALLVSAWVAGFAGILGYFDVAGLGSVFSYASRASGTFKDPNVLGPYLVLPLLLVIYRMLMQQIGVLKGLMLISLPLFALFLTFSRGAWGNFILSTILLFVLTFVTARTAGQRGRVIGFSLLIVATAIVALLIALSFDSIREIFEIRASLNQSYDQGVQGRFGSQFRSIPLLLEMPNGMGPLRFRWTFPEDPHNTFINAFASYGWLGGFSYAALFLATMYAGWTTVFRACPTQPYAIAIWSVLFMTLLQGIQIDIDHWRHVYMLLGLIWGLRAIAPEPARAPSTTAEH